MKIRYDKVYGEYEIIDGALTYNETDGARATSRLLDGSRDHGYWMEYKGYGTVGEYPVIAIYLLEEDEGEKEDEGDWDWDRALDNGRIIIDIDKMSDSEVIQLGKECD